MKRNFVSILLLLMLLSIFCCGCSDLPRDTIVSKEDHLDEDVAIGTKQPTVPTKTTTTTKRTTTTVAEIASRKNPAGMGERIILSGRKWDGTDFQFVIMIDNPIRGQEAMKMAQGWNRFNSIDENEEIIIVDVLIELTKWDNPDDERFRLSYWSFEFFDTQYSKQKSDNYIVVKDELSVELYEGGEATGRLAFIVPENTDGYIVYDEQFWWRVS